MRALNWEQRGEEKGRRGREMGGLSLKLGLGLGLGLARGAKARREAAAAIAGG